jgi:RNA polymerase sigma factor for flagellar operon FliA
MSDGDRTGQGEGGQRMSVGNARPSGVEPGLPKRQGGGEKELSGLEDLKALKELTLDYPELYHLSLADPHAASDADPDCDPDLGSDANLDADRMLAELSPAEPAFAYPLKGMGEEANSAGIPAPERDRLLLEHLPTVRYLARRIHERLPQHVELEDLISAGVVGLIDAFSKFDHTKKVQFKSYAQFRIRGAILDSLRTLDWSPRELRRKGRAVEEAIRSTTQRLGRAPAEPEIALEMGLTLSEFQQLLGDLKGLEIGSLHIERTEDSGDQELAYIPGSPEEDPLFRCLKGEMKQRLADAIEELPERERLVLTLYYYEELTMKEIGLTLGVVESRVSQIHSAAVLRLRVALAALRGGKSEAGGKLGATPRPGSPGSTGSAGLHRPIGV